MYGWANNVRDSEAQEHCPDPHDWRDDQRLTDDDDDQTHLNLCEEKAWYPCNYANGNSRL